MTIELGHEEISKRIQMNDWRYANKHRDTCRLVFLLTAKTPGEL